MNELCPTCGQALPQTRRVCGQCHGPIKRHHRWHTVGSVVQHRNCQDPTLSQQTAEQHSQTMLIEDPAL